MDKKPKDRVNSIFIVSSFAIVLLLIIFAYSAGLANNKNFVSRENVGGAAYSFPQQNCVVYTNEVVVVDEDCITRSDCAPNGICISDIGKCGYFVN